MPRPRAPMRIIREVLRLGLGENMSPRQIALSVGMGRTTVQRRLAKAASAGLTWPLPEDMDDQQLEQLLFSKPEPPPGEVRSKPDWAQVHRELKRKKVTLQLLHMEYKQANPDGFQYTWFTEHYRRWLSRVDVVMRQEHRAGEKLFVDFAGDTIPIVDRVTGAVTPADLFVAVLGASSFTYAEAVESQTLACFLGAHVNAFEYFGAAPQILVPDNLKSGVTHPHPYEPVINRSYQELATHYNCAIIPARIKKPRDKAKVEAGVLIAERWLIASLRNVTFFSVAEANAAIRQKLDWLNNRPFQKLPGCRRSTFEELDRPALRPLPVTRYEFATWKAATVNIDYHVEVDRHYYSVPYQLARQRLEVRITANTVEAFWGFKRVASHVRSAAAGRHTTDPAHMPESHRRHLEWTPSRLITWASKTGPATVELVKAILESRPHPEQGFRSCLGIFRLGREYGAERLEAASRRALAAQALSQRSMASILKTGLDRQPLPSSAPERAPILHENVRGSNYYQ